MSEIHIQSYGGGVQSAALLVLTAQGKIENPATHAVFSDTGSELQATYRHIEEVAKPYAAAHGIEFVTVNNPKYGKLHEYQVENRHLMIPMFGDRGGILRRQCTDKFKIRPVRRWLRAQGAKSAVVQLGISWDEVYRAKDANVKWAVNRWPLLELNITRADCVHILTDAGVRVPAKSACFICPYRRMSSWKELREKSPLEFRAAVAFEGAFPGEYLTSSGARRAQSLSDAVGQQMLMFDDDECGGYCWT